MQQPQAAFDRFNELLAGYYAAHARQLPWRTQHEPYRVLVSEVMLQQTQVPRVTSKFIEFLEVFPTIDVLACASLSDVLARWSGLGYNRRANYLLQAARSIRDTYGGEVPDDTKALESLPGIGPDTAGAIRCYGFNQPAVFIETNIRTVFIHHFFSDAATVSDMQLKSLVERAMDRDNPRVWYWSLMDYGSHLKKTAPPVLSKSTQYRKQSPFAGSLRQVRGAIIKQLLESGGASKAALMSLPGVSEALLEKAVAGLEKDKLIMRRGNTLHLTEG